MFKITAMYNNESFIASLPDDNNIQLFSRDKRDDFSSMGKGTYVKQVPMSDLSEFYLERFYIFYRGQKTGLIKFISNKNVLMLGTTSIDVANNLRFYKSDGNQWLKNINFTDVEKIILEKYDFLTKEKVYTEYNDNFETLIKLKLSTPKKEEEDNNEQKEIY